jgi:hypothetical protein
VARSWTVTSPAATAPVGCRMMVVRVGLKPTDEQREKAMEDLF